MHRLILVAVLLLGLSACATQLSPHLAAVTVKLDFDHKPLPDLPLPNDLATRYDKDSATLRRLNASMLAPTLFERTTRELIDQLDGWGVYAPITIPFTGEIDVADLAKRHQHDDYAFPDDAVYVIDLKTGLPAPLDIGNGNFPVLLEQLDGYWRSDPRGQTQSLIFEEYDEDVNKNGILDPGEDTDLDGILDKPNYLPSTSKSMTEMDKAERADALMTFWERETHTLIVRPLVPLHERTTYAVVVSNRVKDSKGVSVGSPTTSYCHGAQTEALQPMLAALAAHPDVYGNLSQDQIAFAWTFTTASIYTDLQAVRSGLYGIGAQAHLHDAYPPDLNLLHPLYDGKPKFSFENRYALSGESFVAIAQLLNASGVVKFGGPEQTKRVQDGLKYVGFHAFGTFASPQMFPNKDSEGNYLHFNTMSWPADLDRKPAPARSEDVTFWLTLPRKEVTGTKDGKPKAVVILGHGYTGSKTEVFNFHPFFSELGLAVIAIDDVSHGFSLSGNDKKTLDNIFGGMGVRGLGDALTSNRSWDQDLDGLEDSGADFWTSYTFHTRDVVRQSAVDYMQLVRVLRSWDGTKKWQWDVNGNGLDDDIAGDFDGDGGVDVGGPTMPITMAGGSLGGIMSAILGGSEPEISAILPVSGGGGLTDVGLRSIQGGVREAVELRVMGPLYVGYSDRASGGIAVKAVVPRLNKTAEIAVASVPQAIAGKLAVGDSILANNVSNNEYDCARVTLDQGCAGDCDGDGKVTDKIACKQTCLTFRIALPSSVDRDKPEQHKLAFYKGDVFRSDIRDEERDRACSLRADAGQPLLVLDHFEHDVNFSYQSQKLQFKKGDPLAPLAEGLGLKRGSPGLRRFLGFAQMVFDPADPAVLAARFQMDQPLATGQTLHTHALVLNTVGDMNVPVNTGASIGRAAGLLDYTKKVPEWGNRTVNQTLIDTYVLEAIDKIPRFLAPDGSGVLMDPEDLSNSATPGVALPLSGTKIVYPQSFARGKDGFNVPRLNPPLHSKAVGPDKSGGISGTFFPYVEPTGKHGFYNPGWHVDFLTAQCKEDAAKAGIDPSTCASKDYFDHGSLLVYMMGYYLRSAGTEFRLDACQSSGKCSDIPKAPPARQ